MEITMRTLKIVLAVVLLIIIAGILIFFLADDTMAEYYINRGDSALESGKVEKALRYYEKALSRVPENAEICMLAAEWHAQLENYTKAEQLLFAGIKVMPSESRLYSKLSAVYVRQDKLLDAAVLLDSVRDERARDGIDAIRPSAPALTPGEGTYNEYFSVTISVDPDCYCFFAYAGEYPSVNGQVYSGPIEVGDGETIITAVAVDPDGNVSSMVKVTYKIADVLQIAEFSESAVLNAVRRSLNKADNLLIISSEAAEIESLSVTASDGVMTSLSDLKWLPNLKTLKLDSQPGLNWAELKQLEGLESLTLSNCDISTQDLEIICAIDTIVSLNLAGNRIAGLTALQALPGLRELTLSMNSISDLGPLSGIKGLEKLIIAENAVSDISVLKSLENLVYFDAEDNIISDISALSKNTVIEYLNFTRCPITDISALGGCTGLKTLVLDFCYVEDISTLGGCTSLLELSMASNLVSDIGPITGLTALAYLNLGTNKLSALPDMSGMTGLSEVYMQYNEIYEVRAFVGMPSLNVLNLDYNKLTSVAGLAGCPSLGTLYCFGNDITDKDALDWITIYG